MKNKKTHFHQVLDGKTRPTKRERKELEGFGRSGNVDFDAYRPKKQKRAYVG